MSRYIVTLSRETTSAQLKEYADKIIQRGGKINHTYDSAILKGFAVSISDSLVTTLDDDPNVKSVGKLTVCFYLYNHITLKTQRFLGLSSLKLKFLTH
ncbi:hypothetical protein BY996DRAFT_7700713 [Phakopsora pachyrhizi]|nr:hypothetical protein BY996DRAFT_7700713 [Phakopsora pachyrhizi]